MAELWDDSTATWDDLTVRWDEIPVITGDLSMSIPVVFQISSETIPTGPRVMRIEREKRAFRVTPSGIMPIHLSQVVYD